jgi:hypothetical protein
VVLDASATIAPYPVPLAWSIATPAPLPNHRPRQPSWFSLNIEPTTLIPLPPLAWRTQQPDLLPVTPPRRLGIMAQSTEPSLFTLPPILAWNNQRPGPCPPAIARQPGLCAIVLVPALFPAPSTAAPILISMLSGLDNMAIKGQQLTITYTAWNVSANQVVRGDAANHTLYLTKDGGTPVATTNAPTEVDTNHMQGVYQVTLTATEMTANAVRVAGQSSTANVVLIFAGDIITEQGVLPGGTTPGTLNGLPTADAGNRVKANTTQFGGQDIVCQGPVLINAGILASTTNITAGTMTNVTNLINLPLIPASWVCTIVSAIWQDLVTDDDFMVPDSIGKLLVSAYADPWATSLPGSYPNGSAGSILGHVLGGGITAVDHNYGGTDALAYQAGGGYGIVGATILAYLSSDYAAGHFDPQYVVGRTTTVAGGRWNTPLFLGPGTYTLVFQLPGSDGPDITTITV